MKNWMKKMSKEKAQRFLFIGILILVFSIFFISLSLLEPNNRDPKPPHNDPIEDPGNNDDIIPERIIAPIKGSDYETIRKFWSYDAPTGDQEKSIIVYGTTYYMSKGLSYAKDDEVFEVVACLTGKVIKVTDSPTYGNRVIIEHSDGLVSDYMSLGTVTVAEGDIVEQGQVIGTSGNNEYDIDAGIHVHFQLQYNGKNVNPEALINVRVDEVKDVLA